MLCYEADLAEEAPLDEEGLGQTDARVEVEVGHRHGIFKNVPETFLRVEEIEICPEWKGASGEALGYRDLELNIRVVARHLLSDRAAEYEIVVLVESEIGGVVKCPSDAVGVNILVADVDNLSLHLRA